MNFVVNTSIKEQKKISKDILIYSDLVSEESWGSVRREGKSDSPRMVA